MNGAEYSRRAQEQQYGRVELPAKRGEIYSRNSKTGELSILATNTTLDLLYIDPLIIPGDHAEISDELSEILVTQAFDIACRKGTNACPNELIQFYRPAFDPLAKVKIVESGFGSGATVMILTGALALTGDSSPLPDITEVKRQFARYIEDRIRRQTVTFVPLLYSANKKQIADVVNMRIPGIYVNDAQKLVYTNPDLVDQSAIGDISRLLSPVLKQDPSVLKNRRLQRPLRYVPVMGRLPPELSRKIRELKVKHAKEAAVKAAKDPNGKTSAQAYDAFRAVAMIPEHWRFYPDTRIASHVIGFINTQSEPQYGIERTYDSVLRGQKGSIASVSDPFGGQIVSSDQKFIDPRDGSTITLTIDRFIQSKVEELLDAMVKKVDAESGQVIIIDPYTGRIVAMANAPLFDNNSYAAVYEKEPIVIDPNREKQIVVEVFNPETNARVVKAYVPDIEPEGRTRLSPEIQDKLKEFEALYELPSISRYYMYLGDNNRREVFPTIHKGVWLKYKNNIGIGSYVNRNVQEVYEPGSVMKSVTMAIAIDQGEVSPLDIYNDTGAVKIADRTIKNALNTYYGISTMVDCIDFSINTCMTWVSQKLGRKLFRSALEQFGFGRISGIELDNEQPGDLEPWSGWDVTETATRSFGQGITTTPLQMITAYTALANGGKLMRPTIVDQIEHADGTIDKRQPTIVAQVIKPETASTITAMLVHSAQFGFAKAGKVNGHRIAGKTGTSQIAGPGGKYESGTGSTIATYAGYAPADHPKFVILVKLDRPKKDDFGSKSAAPLFKDIAQFLFDYYGIPPDEK